MVAHDEQSRWVDQVAKAVEPEGARTGVEVAKPVTEDEEPFAFDGQIGAVARRLHVALTVKGIDAA